MSTDRQPRTYVKAPNEIHFLTGENREHKILQRLADVKGTVSPDIGFYFRLYKLKLN
jgi:hypothetical protein